MGFPGRVDTVLNGTGKGNMDDNLVQTSKQRDPLSGYYAQTDQRVVNNAHR